MNRSSSPVYLPAREALIPKECRFCHQRMEIKQINLTVAVRQCFKCSVPLQQLDFDDIEFFHRSYEDIHKAPNDWSSNVRTEESELNQLGLWIEQIQLTVSKYAETSDDEEPAQSNSSIELEKAYSQEVKNSGDEIKWDDLVDSLDLDLSKSNPEWNNADIDELDEALAKAVSERSDPKPLPFSLDEIICKQVPVEPSSPLVLQKINSTEQTNFTEGLGESVATTDTSCSNEIKQVFLSEKTGDFMNGTDGVEMPGRSPILQAPFPPIVHAEKPNDADNLDADTTGEVNCLADNPVDTDVDVCVNDSGRIPTVRLLTPSLGSNTEANNEASTDQEFGEKSPESDASPTIENIHNADLLTLGQSSPNQVLIENDTAILSSSASLSDNHCYSSKKDKDVDNNLVSTVTPNGIIITFPSSLVPLDSGINVMKGSAPLIYQHICDCDDTALQLTAPSEKDIKELCVPLELPELTRKNLFLTEVDKVIFSPMHRFTKGVDCPNSNFNVDTGLVSTHEDEEARNSFETIGVQAVKNLRDGILITIPANITEGMLPPVNLPDLPIFIQYSDGSLVSVSSNPSQSLQSEPLLLQVDDGADDTSSQVSQAVPILLSGDGFASPSCFAQNSCVDSSCDSESTTERSATESVSHEPSSVFSQLCLNTSSAIEFTRDKQTTELVPFEHADFGDMGSNDGCLGSHSQRNTTVDIDDFESSQFSVQSETASSFCQSMELAEEAPQQTNVDVMARPEKPLSFLIDKPLQAHNAFIDEDDDELGFFTGTKFKLQAKRISQTKPKESKTKPEEPNQKPMCLNLMRAVQSEVRVCVDGKRKKTKQEM